MRKIITAIVVALGLALGLASCTTDADTVKKNIGQDADNFKVYRRILFVNGITDKIELQIEGFCSIDPADPMKIIVTCAKPGGGYINQYLLKSDNVFAIVDQLDASHVSPNYYHSTIKPSTIVPDIEFR
jgi:hypothetical protein